MTTSGPRPATGRWYAPGDVNAFFGLAVDNLTNLVVLAGLLVGVFGFPADLVLYRIVPGTALGVLVGDLWYTWLALRLGAEDRTHGRHGDALRDRHPFVVRHHVRRAGADDARRRGDPVLAWKVGMGTTVAMGVAKLVLAFSGEWVRRVVPRAGLLGSIAGVSALLIAFLPTLKVVADPLVGFVSLGLILVALVGRITLPGRVPGALAAVAVGGAVSVVEHWLGIAPVGHALAAPGEWRLAVPWPTLAWLDAMDETWAALSVALPFALATVVGGIDNTESAIAAGDTYRTRDILLTEALATIVAGVAGGVVQNTPYVGHPAYKAMGARAGYTLATGLVIGVGAMAGVVSILVGIVPEAAVAPILIFVGLEITAQAFLATPARHAPAVALAFIPTTAALVLIQLGSILAGLHLGPGALRGDAAASVQTLRLLGNGFILTALLWAAAVAMIIDRRLLAAAATLAVASVASLCGVIHSPLESGGLFWPGRPPSEWPGLLAGGYGLVAALLVLLATWTPRGGPAPPAPALEEPPRA